MSGIQLIDIPLYQLIVKLLVYSLSTAMLTIICHSTWNSHVDVGCLAFSTHLLAGNFIYRRRKHNRVPVTTDMLTIVKLLSCGWSTTC